MRNPKAFLLNEMLLIIALLSLITLLSVKPMQIFLRGVMETHKAFDRQEQLETLLATLQQDTENAAYAFVHIGDERLTGDVLYLSGPDGVVGYQFDDGAATCISGDGTQEWELPRVEFDWRLLTLEGDAQAVAVTTRQRHKRRADGTFAFRGSRVFVVNLNAAHPVTESE